MPSKRDSDALLTCWHSSAGSVVPALLLFKKTASKGRESRATNKTSRKIIKNTAAVKPPKHRSRPEFAAKQRQFGQSLSQLQQFARKDAPIALNLTFSCLEPRTQTPKAGQTRNGHVLRVPLRISSASRRQKLNNKNQTETAPLRHPPPCAGTGRNSALPQGLDTRDNKRCTDTNRCVCDMRAGDQSTLSQPSLMWATNSSLFPEHFVRSWSCL